MDFTQGSSIYEQIMEHVQVYVISGKWNGGDRVPSVRDMAVRLGVNPNTVQRSYALLQDEGILENRRGIGYFIADAADQKSRTRMKDEFISSVLPWLKKRLDLLEISSEELGAMLDDYKAQQGE